MCFAKRSEYWTDLSPMYDNDGTVNDEISTTSLVIPEDIIEHIDDPFLNKDVEKGILALIYETRYHILIVWTSDEAYNYIKHFSPQ